jgi:hypothetical protein
MSTAPCPQDPVLESLRNAPVDDEPETPEERAAVECARAELQVGAPTTALEDYASKWGIRLMSSGRRKQCCQHNRQSRQLQRVNCISLQWVTCLDCGHQWATVWSECPERSRRRHDYLPAGEA